MRNGPDDYTGSAEVTAAGPEAACRQAVVNALDSMAGEAKERRYSLLINIRSRLNDAFTPDASQVECAVGKKTASVTLQASLAANE